MTELQTLTLEELCAVIEIPAPTLILLHRGPDGDAIGSAFALRQVFNALGSEAWCVCADEMPERLRFLASPMQDSILLSAVPEEFLPERVISVDVASPAQLGDLNEIYGEHVDLMIDHHENGTPFAPSYIRPDAAATGEILFDVVRILAEAGKLTVTEEICTDLYAAISSDTGCFRYSNVTPDTHTRAAELVASGIDCAEINHLLFESKSMEQLKATAAGISNLNVFYGGKLAVITFPYALKAALGLADEHLETLVDVARSLAGVSVAISIRQPSRDTIFRVSVRSSCDYNVAELCARFGGGGHARAAGCTLSAKDIEEAMNKLVDAINPNLL